MNQPPSVTSSSAPTAMSPPAVTNISYPVPESVLASEELREQERELWPQEIDGIPFPQPPRPSQSFMTRQDHFAARLDALVLNSTRTNDLLSSHIARFDKYIDDRQRSDLQDRWERYEFDKKRYIYEKQVRDQAARQEAKLFEKVSTDFKQALDQMLVQLEVLFLRTSTNHRRHRTSTSTVHRRHYQSSPSGSSHTDSGEGEGAGVEVKKH